MAVFLDFTWIHQLSATNRLKVDQTCPMGFTFAHVFSQKVFNYLNKLDTSVMDTIEERFKGIFPYQGVTQKCGVYFRSLDAHFC